MLERREIQLSTSIMLRLNNEFKFRQEEEKKTLYAFYNAQEKVLICSTGFEDKIPDTYFLGHIGSFKEVVVLTDRMIELFKDYELIPSEKEGRLCINLFNKGKGA